jgi:hypothetical protein
LAIKGIKSCVPVETECVNHEGFLGFKTIVLGSGSSEGFLVGVQIPASAPSVKQQAQPFGGCALSFDVDPDSDEYRRFIIYP